MTESGSTTTSSVALRPWPVTQEGAIAPPVLYKKVEQLTSERGYLRSITEKSLQDDIDAGNHVTGDSIESIEQNETKNTPTKQERIQELSEKKIQMAQKLEWASFNAGNALDLITQLLSRDPTKNLDKSFSEKYRQQHIPKNAFGLDKGAPMDKSDLEIEQTRIKETEKKEMLVSRGSRMEAVEWAADSLLDASVKLQTEVRKENRYWNEIISISQKGWPLQRFRRETRNSPFAVRYGFSEASDHFKGRGLAPLRMDKDGSIILDPTLALKPKTLRVRISDTGKITGTSCLPPQDQFASVAIEESIQFARDSLLEEELFHEMSLETRQLLGYGVELRDSVISLQSQGVSRYSTDKKILIDCIARNDGTLGSQDQSESWLAQNVAEALRLLLTHEHRMRLFQRSQLPPPLAKHKQTRPNPPLLRTLLAVLNHLNAVDSLHTYLTQTEITLRSAGINVSLRTTRETSWATLTNVIMESTRQDFSVVDRLLDIFTKPLNGLATISLPSSEGDSEQISIATRTYIGNPTFGTEHKVTLPPSSVSLLSLSSEQKREFKFSSTEEVKSYLDWILSLDISHTLLPTKYGRRAFITSKNPRVSILYKDGKEQKRKDITVQVTDARLNITVGSVVASKNTYIEEVFTWDGTASKVSFSDKLGSWLG